MWLFEQVPPTTAQHEHLGVPESTLESSGNSTESACLVCAGWQGAVDLRVLARSVAPDALVSHTKGAGAGLAGLASALLARSVDKAQQCSHWGREVLSSAQVAYAAQDAWVSRQLLLELFARHLAAHQSGPDAPGSGAGVASARATDGSDLHSQFVAFVAPYVDQHHVPHSQPAAAAPSLRVGHGPRAGSSTGSADGGGGGANGMGRDGSSSGSGSGAGWSAQIRKPARHALRKKQLYENCRLMVGVTA
jgi:exonuclease 3'-5' domain-containing protein 2